MATLESLEAGQRLAFKLLNGQMGNLAKLLERTNRDLVALIGVLNAKGITIDQEEWDATRKELDAALAIEQALDPRLAKAEELWQRQMAGEEIPEDELNQWLRDVEEGGAG